jgi:hypothetical protein
MPEARIASFNLSERTCASSEGGPGLNLDEQRAGRSRLGTVQEHISALLGFERTK